MLQLESVLHLACEFGLQKLTDLLLEKGADPNIQTSRLANSESPMHRAILKNNDYLLDSFIKHKGECPLLLFLLCQLVRSFSCL